MAPCVRWRPHAWLSITPEPETRAARRHRRRCAPAAPRRPRSWSASGPRGGLVLRGSRRAWLRYLAEALALADVGSDDPAVRDARSSSIDVVHNHDNLELGSQDESHARPPPPPRPATARTSRPSSSSCSERARRFVEEVLIPTRSWPSARRPPPATSSSSGSSARRSRRACRAACTRSSTAARAGRRSSGSSSRSSSGAPPTRSPGTCRAPTTCSRAARPSRSSASCKPALRGELHDAYAVTEEEAGSDPSRIADHGRRDRRRLGDRRREVVRHLRRRRGRLHRHGERARGRRASRPTLFLVDRALDGIEIVDDPPFTPHLSARPPDGALHRRRGGRRRGDRRHRRRRRPPALVVHRGADRDRRARAWARCGG